MPACVVAIAVGVGGDHAAARLAFLVAGGVALAMEATAWSVVRAAWARRFWPPSEGDPAAVAPVFVGLLSVAGCLSLATPATAPSGLQAGARGALAAVAIQATAALLANLRQRGRGTPVLEGSPPPGRKRH